MKFFKKTHIQSIKKFHVYKNGIYYNLKKYINRFVDTYMYRIYKIVLFEFH